MLHCAHSLLVNRNCRYLISGLESFHKQYIESQNPEQVVREWYDFKQEMSNVSWHSFQKLWFAPYDWIISVTWDIRVLGMAYEGEGGTAAGSSQSSPMWGVRLRFVTLWVTLTCETVSSIVLKTLAGQKRSPTSIIENLHCSRGSTRQRNSTMRVVQTFLFFAPPKPTDVCGVKGG